MQSFMAVCIQYFGLKAGQTKIEFGREVLRLSPADKAEIHAGFLKLGIECAEPMGGNLPSVVAVQSVTPLETNLA